MLKNMSPSGSNLEEQLSSIMDVLAKAAVSEICQLFSEGSTTLRLQITRSLKENEALRKRMKVMRSELFSLRLQTRSNASRAASRFALARANICKPRTKPLGNEHCDAFGDRSTQQCANSESLRVDAPGSSHMSSFNGELRILSVHGQGEGPLAVDGQDTLFTMSELEALSSLSADHSLAKSLDCGEWLIHHKERTVQLHTPVAILIKGEEDIGGGMPAVDCNDIRDCRTQRGTTSQSLCVDAPGSSHMSSHNGELRILSVHGKGEGPLAVDGHDTLFTPSEVEALSPLPADQSLAMSLDCGERLVHREVLTGPRGGRKGCVVCGREFPNYAQVMVHMRTHTGETPYRCEKCMKCFQGNYKLKLHMRTHSGEKPEVCLQCKASFSDPSNLRRHMYKHTGNRTL